MKEIIKFSGSQDEDARAFLRGVVESENYRYQGLNHTLKVTEPESCDTSLFKDDSELPIFEGSRREDAVNPRYAIAKVCVSARDFLKAQAKIREIPYQIYRHTTNREQLDRVKEGMRKGHKVPIPVLEFQPSGILNPFQEGRHRAVAAIETNKNYMPIFIAKEV